MSAPGGDLVSAPGGAADFDFLVGGWDVAHRRLVRPLAGCEEWDEFEGTSRCWQLFGGAANVDELPTPARGFTGLTLRLFSPARREWSIYWANSKDGLLGLPPVVGRFTGGVGLFYSDETLDGRRIRVRFTWSQITPTSARWEQAFSADAEQTWETNWIMSLTRRSGHDGARAG